MKYYINIGSNLGNRLLNISKAVSAIEKCFGWFELSKTVESEPWGFDSTHKFLNIGMLFISDREPTDVLHELQRIERRLSPSSHRTADGSYADRVLDIDIMAVDGIEMHTDELTLPHPHLRERPFFFGSYQELLEKSSGLQE